MIVSVFVCQLMVVATFKVVSALTVVALRLVVMVARVSGGSLPLKEVEDGRRSCYGGYSRSHYFPPV